MKKNGKNFVAGFVEWIKQNVGRKSMARKQSSSLGSKPFAEAVFLSAKDSATLFKNYVMKTDGLFRTEKSDALTENIFVGAVVRNFIHFKEWKDNGVIHYDDSLQGEVDEIIASLYDKESWESLEEGLGIKPISQITNQLKNKIEGFYDKLPRHCFIREKADSCIALIGNVESLLTEVKTYKGGRKGQVVIGEEKLMIEEAIKRLLREVNEISYIYTSYKRADSNEDKESLKEFELRYQLFPGAGVFERDPRFKKVADAFETLAEFENPLDMVLRSSDTFAGESEEGAVLFERIKKVVEKTTITSGKAPRLVRAPDISGGIRKIAQDERISQILDKKEGMSSEDFDYVFGVLADFVSQSVSKSYLGSAFKFKFDTFESAKSSQLKGIDAHRAAGFFAAGSPYGFGEIYISKDVILNVNEHVDFSKGSLRKVSKLPLAQRQFAWLVSVMAHEGAHCADEAIRIMGLEGSKKYKGPEFPLQDYIKEDFTKTDLVMLSMISPSLAETMSQMEDKEIESLIKVLKYAYYRDEKEERFARANGKVAFDCFMAMLSDEYANLGEDERAGRLSAVLGESVFINANELPLSELEAEMLASGVVDRLLEDLRVAQDPDKINLMCFNYQLLNWGNEKVSKTEDAAYGLVVRYFYGLEPEERQKFLSDAIRHGCYDLCLVLSGERGHVSLVGHSTFGDCLNGVSVEDVVGYFRSIADVQAMGELKEKQVLDSGGLFYLLSSENASISEKTVQAFDYLKKDNNVLEMLNYLRACGRQLDTEKFEELVSWASELDQLQKCSVHYFQFLDNLEWLSTLKLKSSKDPKVKEALGFIKSERERQAKSRAVVKATEIERS